MKNQDEINKLKKYRNLSTARSQLQVKSKLDKVGFNNRFNMGLVYWLTQVELIYKLSKHKSQEKFLDEEFNEGNDVKEKMTVNYYRQHKVKKYYRDKIREGQPETISEEKLKGIITGLCNVIEKFKNAKENGYLCLKYIFYVETATHGSAIPPKHSTYQFTPDIHQRLTRRNIFIGGHFDDMQPYRGSVLKMVMDKGHTPLEPIYSGENYNSTCNLISQQIKTQADAYVGILGARYGSPYLENRSDVVSYAHFEFRESREKWGEKHSPPIFLFRPKPNTAFYEEVKSCCDNELQTICGDNQKLLAEDQKKFVDLIEEIRRPLDDNEIASWSSELVESKEALAKKIENRVYRYFKGFPESDDMRAAPATYPTQRSTENFNRQALKQTYQWQQAVQIYHQFGKQVKQKFIPGLCIFIHGMGRKGQRELATLLADDNIWPDAADHKEPRELDRHEHGNLQIPWESLWNAVEGQPKQSELTDADALAKELIMVKMSTTVIFCQIQFLEGKLKGFVEKVWHPIYDSLNRAVLEQGMVSKGDYYLHMLVTYEGRRPIDDKDLETYTNVNPRAKKIDYRKPVLLSSF